LSQLISKFIEIRCPHCRFVACFADGPELEFSVYIITRHQQGNATTLPFNDAAFDSCRSERLFQHLICPERALFEMARVTKPDGCVVVLDTDWGSCSIATSLINIERRLHEFALDHLLNNPYSGRRLLELFRFQGLKDLSVEVLPYQITSYALAREVTVLDRWENETLKAGVITRDELENWHDDLEQLDREESFFASLNLVLVAGRV